MSGPEKVRRLKKDQWRPKGEDKFRRPIDVYFEKYPGLTVEELKVANPRLLEAIDLNNQKHLIAGEIPEGYQELGSHHEEYQALVAAYEAAFTSPRGIRKKMFRTRRFGLELLRWLLETYPDGLPLKEDMRNGTPEERKFYNDLKYARLLRFLKKMEPLDGKDPVELYYQLCRSERRIITRGQLKHPSMAGKGGNAIYKALERMRDPKNSSRSLLQKHVPLNDDKLSAEAVRRFNFEE